MPNDPTLNYLRTLFQVRLARARQARDHGAFSIEMAMIVAGLVVVAGIIAGVLLSKVNEKKNQIK